MKNISLILLTLISFSCGKNFGTNTGNPDQQNQETPVPACGKARCLPDSFSVANLIYGRLVSCRQDSNPPPDDFDKILNQPGLNLELPLSETTFNELSSSETHNQLITDRNSYDKCTAAIYNLGCDNAQFKSAYDVNNPNDYTNIHKIFRIEPACLTMFTDKI